MKVLNRVNCYLLAMNHECLMSSVTECSCGSLLLDSVTMLDFASIFPELLGVAEIFNVLVGISSK